MSKYVLADLFEGDYRISQLYGANPNYYKQYGFAGHEGVDWATPVGVKILAPFNGKILRNETNPRASAYGIYIVVWDPTQRCAVWYAHLSESYVAVGQMVTKGQILGKTGNTGNSTGPHIHVGFVETDGSGNRLHMTNGYKGFLNILDRNLVEWRLGKNAEPAPAPAPIPSVTLEQYYTDMGSKQVEIERLSKELESALRERDSAILERDDALTKLAECELHKVIETPAKSPNLPPKTPAELLTRVLSFFSEIYRSMKKGG
jgi:hypothetical protein